MSDDIRVGDVVVCVDARPNPAYPTCDLRAGRTYRVSGLHIGRVGYPDAGQIGLFLEGLQSLSPSGSYHSRRFRKIDAPKTEISERIRACRPIPVAADYGQKVVVR